MRNFLLLLALGALVISGCSKDDDDNGGGSGGADGDLLIRLTWDQQDADLDLAVSGPNALILAGGFSNLTGATHSGDDLTGPGEETIMFDNVAPDGDYSIEIEWFDGAGDVSYTLRVESAADGRTFDETINSTNDLDRITFTKNGRNLSF